MTQPPQFISEADFHGVWQVITKDSGDFFNHADIVDRPLTQVWTIVDSGDDLDQNWYAIPGIHLVNRLGFVLTRREWIDESVQAIYFESDAEEEDLRNNQSAG